MFKLGIIGGGAMGSALATGVLKADLIPADQLFLAETDPQKSAALQTKLGCQSVSDLNVLAEQCQTIILAVKPKVVPTVLKELKAATTQNHLIISIAAGVTLSFLEEYLTRAKVVRVMPNTPAQIGRGVSVYCLGRNATEVDAEKVMAILGCVGKVLQLPEELFDAATALSGSGPAYVYQFIAALTDAGVMLGLSRSDAILMATETVSGAAELVKESGEHPIKLSNDVTSPGGTTAAALFELEKSGFTGIIMKALLVAAQRSKELGKING